MSLRCGHCKERHQTVDQARTCSKLRAERRTRRSGLALGGGRRLQTLGSFMRMDTPKPVAKPKRIETPDERIIRICAEAEASDEFNPNKPPKVVQSRALERMRKEHAKRPVHPVTAAIRRGEITQPNNKHEPPTRLT